MLSSFLFALLWATVVGVDKNNFKTCSSSGFCKRQRAYSPDVSPYNVLLDTAKVDGSKLSVEVINTQTSVRLRLEMSAIQGNMARLRITEVEQGIKERYELPIGDVLTEEPQLDSLKVDSNDQYGYTLSFGSNKLVLQAKPFRIDFVIESEPVISINAKGLLKFEQYRVKNEGGGGEEEKPAEEGGEQEQQEGEQQEEEPAAEEAAPAEEEEPDMWEETFKSHKDTKPFGPSSVGLDISFNGFEYVYGIPSHADSLALKSTKDTDPYRLYNLDVFEYELNNPMALYGAVPVLYAHNEKHTVGMFWLNAAETWIDVRPSMADKMENFRVRYSIDEALKAMVTKFKQKGTFSKLVDLVKGDSDIPQVDTHWMSESGIIDVFLLMGPTANDVFKQYAKLTGTTPLPPLFAMAYHQCRWNYNDEEDVATVDAGFDEYDIPMDVMWLDIEHTDGKRYFTWDKTRFPNPSRMIDQLSAKGRRMVTVVDPHLKKDEGYSVFTEARDTGLMVHDHNDNVYEGFCWPGSSGWPDFLDPKVREWWADKFSLDQYEGSTEDLYIWNDMNEPSVFNGPEVTMHKDAKHYGGHEHRDVHNIYGTYVHRATVEGLMKRGLNEKRPFVLSRAFFAGSQRYGAIWTGDNTGEWGHLKISVPMLLSLNIAGITFSGADVGGFFKNPDSELLTRWYQAGAYQPFFRAHAHHDSRRREPWLLPEENTAIIRSAIMDRYRLLPYWYTLYYYGEVNGGPLMKPLWVDYPADKETFALDDQYLLGPALLVKPVTEAGSSGVTVYLPGAEDVWYDVDTYQKYNGGMNVYMPVTLEKIPVFQKGGSVIPRRDRIRRSSSLTYSDPFTLIVALDKQGSSVGDLYVDEYDAFRYRLGEFALRRFTFSNNKLTNSNLNPGSHFGTKAWLERVIIVGVSSQPAAVELTGTGIESSSLQSTYNAQRQTLTIRKPAVNINSDWTITLRR